MKLSKRRYKHEEPTPTFETVQTNWGDVARFWIQLREEGLIARNPYITYVQALNPQGTLYGQGTTTQNSALNYTIQTQAYQSTAGTNVGKSVAYFSRPYTPGEW